MTEERNLWACVHDIVAISPTDVWMVGTGWNEGKEYGLTLHWDGMDWKIFTDLASYNIYSISALSEDNIWAITGNGTVLNWNGVESKEGATLDVADLYSAPVIFAQASDDVYVAGNKVWRWDGKIWADISLFSNIPSDSDITGIVAFPSPAFPLQIWMLDSSGIIYTFKYGK